jgi:hypothetical protein
MKRTSFLLTAFAEAILDLISCVHAAPFLYQATQILQLKHSNSVIGRNVPCGAPSL